MNCIKILSVTHIEIIVLFGYRKLRDRHYQPLGCGPHYWILEWKWRGIVDTNNWWFGKYYFLNNVNCLWSKDRLALPFDIVTVKSRLHVFWNSFCRLWLSFRSTASSNLPQWGKILHPNFSEIMNSYVLKVDRVFCLIHTSYFLDKFCIHTKNECWHKIHIIYGVVLDQKHRWYWRKKLKNCAPLMGYIFFLFSSFFQGGSRRGSSLFCLLHPVNFHQIPPGHLDPQTLWHVDTWTI